MKFGKLLKFSLVLMLFCTGPARSQVNTATLSGEVTDVSGAGIPDAVVVVRNTETNSSVTTKSDGSGHFQVVELQPGLYGVSADHTGFKKVNNPRVQLTVGEPAELNFELPVGNEDVTVTVNSGVELVNGTTAEIATTIGEQEIKELPLNGRNPADLVFLAPGVTNLAETPAAGTYQNQAGNTIPAATLTGEPGGASAGGGRQGSTFYMLDGVPNMDRYTSLSAPFPNSDATQEFRVITNNFGAQYGFAAGGVVNIQTKSGSNTVHGNVFEFIRNDAVNATNYFTHLKDTLKRHQFGGSLGGPILRNRLFLFGNYQQTRLVQARATNTTTTPTPAMLAGDFSGVTTALRAPFATVNGKKNQVNPALFSPAAVAITKFLPVGQGVAGTTNYVGPKIQSIFHEGTGRLDFDLTGHQRITTRVFSLSYHKPGDGGSGNLLAASQDVLGKYSSYLMTHAWTVRPNIVNALSGGYQYYYVNASGGPTDQNGDGICWSRFIKSISEPAGVCSIEGFSAGFTSPSLAPTYEGRYTWSAYDLVTHSLGRHSLIYGVDANHQHVNHSSYYPALPIYSFANTITGYTNADFLLGYTNKVIQGAGESGQLNGWEIGAYAQDQFRIAKDVTLTAGVRWEPFLGAHLTGGRGANFRPGFQSTRYANAPVGLQYPGDAGLDDTFTDHSYTNFNPRVGIAWQPAPGMAFRAGFGMFQQPMNYTVYSHITNIGPFAPTYNYTRTSLGTNALGNYIPLDNPWLNVASTGGKSPFPPFSTVDYVPAANAAVASGVSIGTSFAPNFKLGVTQSWNFSVEQQIAKVFALHLAYVGSESYHQMTPVDQNPGFYNATNAALSDKRILYPQFTSIYQETSAGTAAYHALLTSLNARVNQYITFRLNYTWSKSQDLNSSISFAYANGVPNPYDLRSNRGLSDLNAPQVFTGFFIVQAPSLAGHNWFLRGAIGGWQISNIFKDRSGVPFTITGGGARDNSKSLQAQDRADIVQGVAPQIRSGSKSDWLTHYFNPAAFAANALGTFGTTQRNGYQGPPINSIDTGISKNFLIRERYNFQIRAEAFNTFNHVNFGLPNADPTSNTAGQITSTNANNPPRVMQIAGKITF
jgi:hypothetical protein